MQHFLSLWLNARALITHGGQVQRPRQRTFKKFHSNNKLKYQVLVVKWNPFDNVSIAQVWLIIKCTNMVSSSHVKGNQGTSETKFSNQKGLIMLWVMIGSSFNCVDKASPRGLNLITTESEFQMNHNLNITLSNALAWLYQQKEKIRAPRNTFLKEKWVSTYKNEQRFCGVKVTIFSPINKCGDST